jgi:oxygen-independent coproporphyrinogen III oxidase
MSTPARHVYVHVPFCARRCSYCDFSIAVRRDVPVDEFLAALTAELRARLGQPATLQPIDTLYFGGGTPSHLGADGVRGLVEVMRTWLTWSDDAEVTLEANPDDVSRESVSAWRAAGITRISLGAQSFDPAVLSWMHRSHAAEQIDIAIEHIQRADFVSWSFDLIFALPDALNRNWERDLFLALAKSPPHLSLYGLTIENGTPLGKWSDRGDVRAADEQCYEREFLSAHTAAALAGYDHYEVSNFAQPGHHARHNRSYWRGVPYLGFGPSAHGFDGEIRRWNVAAYAAWRDRCAQGVDPVGGTDPINEPERHLEALYLGLRTTEGLPASLIDPEIAASWIGQKWAQQRGDRLLLTPLGWLRLDGLVSALTPAGGVR